MRFAEVGSAYPSAPSQKTDSRQGEPGFRVAPETAAEIEPAIEVSFENLETGPRDLGGSVDTGSYEAAILAATA